MHTNQSALRYISLALLLCLSLIHLPAYAKKNSLSQLTRMSRASLLVADNKKYSLRPNTAYIPASTMKILTALLALNAWKPEHRFTTEFYLDDEQILWIKGYGDPYLTSEELDKIITELKRKGLTKITGLGVDDSYFSANLRIDGRSKSNNPYDAPASALSLNFNTISVIKNQRGTFSAEAQTPLTKFMYDAAKKLPRGKHRVNIHNQADAARYFGEVFATKLQEQGIQVSGHLLEGRARLHKPPFYRHYNSHQLQEVIKSMLHYSNNFIANQLFLLLGAKHYGAPVSIEKAQQSYSAKVKRLFSWEQKFYEGAGLSRKNKLSAQQLVTILEHFAPYKNLLKSQNSRILAKTGTLTGVSSYAGYLYKNSKWVPFAMLINQPIDINFRQRLAQELLN